MSTIAIFMISALVRKLGEGSTERIELHGVLQGIVLIGALVALFMSSLVVVSAVVSLIARLTQAPERWLSF